MMDTIMPTPCSADLQRWILGASTDGLWIFDDAGITTYANDQMAHILGHRVEEMVGLPVADAFDQPGKEQLRAHLDGLVSAQVGQDNLECSLIRKDGARIWALVSHSPLLDDEGVRRGWLHRVTELTDRKLLLDKVRTSEQQLAEAQSIARIGSWEWDVVNDVVTWSDELYRIYELQPQELEPTYEGFLGHVHPDDRPLVEAAVRSAFTDNETFEFEARIIKTTGQEGWIRGRGRVSRDESGVPVRMGGTAQEITEAVLFALELAAARDAAMQASRMKSEFLATMSHEIRTPLNGVVGLTELLVRSDLDASQRRLADGISQAGRTLLELINDILDFSKIEAGKLELETVDFDVRLAVDQVAVLMVETARTRSTDLTTIVDGGVPRLLRGDPVRFGQVLTNLVSNAVKFTSGGAVTIRVRDVDPQAGSCVLLVEVVDTGIGVPMQARGALFDSFTQADASTTREYGGTGLGLTISRRLVEALGGEIDFTSEVGVGSTFWFTVPFALAGEGPELVSAEPAPSGTGTASVRPSAGVVLVAEDNLVNQMVARGVLEGLGYQVQFAPDGLEAVAAVTATPDRFVAVLMDCQMPRLDGYEATRMVRELERPGARVPVIAMTASTVMGERDRCLAAGMDDILVKPVDFALLETTLASWIELGSAPDRGGSDEVDACGVLDLARVQMLRDLRPGDQSFLEQFVDAFLARAPYDVEAIGLAVRDGDHPRLIESAHGLRGSAQNLGALAIGQVCQALEDAGRRGDSVVAADLVPALTEQLSTTTRALRDLGAAIAEAS